MGGDWEKVRVAAAERDWYVVKLCQRKLPTECVVWFGRQGSGVEPRALFHAGEFVEGQVTVERSDGTWVTVESGLSVNDFVALLRFFSGDDWRETMYGGAVSTVRGS